METITPFQEAIQEIQDAGGDAYRYCYQCGLCDTVCPWNRASNFSMRHLVRQAAFGVPEIEGTDIWRCTTCGNCLDRCPRGVKTVDVAVSFRTIATKYGISPEPVHVVSASLGTEGNPMREARGNRADWTNGLNVNLFTEGMEVLYFPGCYPSYDPRLKKVAAATVKILNEAGVNFGILGTQENCCGESIRKTGNESLYKRLARENIKTFIDNGVHKILVSSPHCYHTFKNEYPEFNVNFEVVHITEYLHELIGKGRLKIQGEYPVTVTYHDPCYLSRYNGICDEPREVLRSVPGLNLAEMQEIKENSFCCGGGGGGIWMDIPRGERLSELRLKQAEETGARELVTACPYCITNFEDSRLYADGGEAVVIKDITEIISEVI